MVHSCSFIQWGAKGGSIQSGNWHWFADAHRAYEVGSYSSKVDIKSKIYAYNSICNTGTYPKGVPVRGGVGGIRCGDRANYQLCIGIGHFTSRGPSVQWKVETQAPSSKLLPAHILVAIHSIPRCRLHENISSTMVQAYQCCQNRTSSVPPIQQPKVEDKRLDGIHGKTCRKLWHVHIFPPCKVPQWWKWLPISWPCTKSVWPSKHVSSAKRRYSRIKPPSATLSCKFRLVWPLVADTWQIENLRILRLLEDFPGRGAGCTSPHKRSICHRMLCFGSLKTQTHHPTIIQWVYPAQNLVISLRFISLHNPRKAHAKQPFTSWLTAANQKNIWVCLKIG